MTPSTSFVAPAAVQPPTAYCDAIYDAVLASVRAHMSAPATRQEETIEERFRRHLTKWREETRFVSSFTVKLAHPDYLAVVALGQPAVPLILRELARRVELWGPALTAITGVSPSPTPAPGDVRGTTKAWLDWGRKRSLLP